MSAEKQLQSEYNTEKRASNFERMQKRDHLNQKMISNKYKMSFIPAEKKKEFGILENNAKLQFAKVLLSLNCNFTVFINRLIPANHRLPRPHGDRINSHKLENTTNTLKHRQTTRYNLIRCVQAYLESGDSIYGTMTQNCCLRRFCPSHTSILRHFPTH